MRNIAVLSRRRGLPNEKTVLLLENFFLNVDCLMHSIKINFSVKPRATNSERKKMMKDEH